MTQFLPPAKRLENAGATTQSSAANSIVLLNPHTLPGSSSGKINISKFSQELSILVNGTDIRFKLPEGGQPDWPQQIARIIFHHPSLSSSYREPCRYFIPSSQYGRDDEMPPSPIQASNLPSGSTLSTDSSYVNLLDGIRTTADEDRFMRTMLNIVPILNDAANANEDAERTQNTITERPLSECNPFILGGQEPEANDNFLALVP